jgi:pimeloyl-ACP methyl ester carboxylesterase
MTKPHPADRFSFRTGDAKILSLTFKRERQAERAEEDDMAWFEHGTSRIYYEETDGSGEVALLLPGLTDSIESHALLRRALVEAGLRVIAADLPGSGRSLPQPRVYSATYFEEDAGSFAALLGHLAAEPAHLIGFSDGGEVALLMTELFPGVVRSVVTWGSAGQINDPSGQLREAFHNVVDNPIPPLQEFSQHLIATYGKDTARATTQNAVRAMTEIIETRGGDISLSGADRITCPVLLIAGEHDPFAPVSLLSQLAARIPDARVLEVKDAGHDVHLSHAEWLITTVVDWVNH